MKKIITLVTVIGLLFMSFSVKEESIITKQSLGTGCSWEMTNSSAVDARRGASCGSDSSLKVYFTNPYTYRVRVAFYLRNANGSLNNNGQPHVISVAPGRRIYHHNCYSNGRYNILVARYDERCSFPNL